jgi:hypothetical protein
LGFRSEVNANGGFLGYYAASSGNSLPTFRDNLSIPFARVKNSLRKPEISHLCEGGGGRPHCIVFNDSKDFIGFSNPEHGTGSMSRNVRKELSVHAA